MATYQYTCRVCDKSLSINRSITDPEGYYKCDVCNEPLKRVYSTIGVQFSGNGFYSTDK